MKARTRVIAGTALRLLAVLAPMAMLAAAAVNLLAGRPVTGLMWVIGAFLLMAIEELSAIRAGVQKLVKFEEDAMRGWEVKR